MRKRRGLTQEQVATRMSVSVARASQIESGDVSTQDVLDRFVTPLGGIRKLTADVGTTWRADVPLLGFGWPGFDDLMPVVRER
jgi:transcriptional regulator with XRE-family HTH domain